MDVKLRDQQVGFRNNRSCIATLRIIIEQCTEWNSSLYISFIDYEKDFDRDTIGKLLWHYGVPGKLVNITRNSYEHLTWKVIHEGQLSEVFEVKTGVRQWCLLSPFLSLLAMKSSTYNRRNGVHCTPWVLLAEIYFQTIWHSFHILGSKCKRKWPQLQKHQHS